MPLWFHLQDYHHWLRAWPGSLRFRFVSVTCALVTLCRDSVVHFASVTCTVKYQTWRVDQGTRNVCVVSLSPSLSHTLCLYEYQVRNNILFVISQHLLHVTYIIWLASDDYVEHSMFLVPCSNATDGGQSRSDSLAAAAAVAGTGEREPLNLRQQQQQQ